MTQTKLIRSKRDAAGDMVRLTQTAKGYALTYRTRPRQSPVPFIGMPPVSWLFRTKEAALVSFDLLLAINGFWRAMINERPRDHLLASVEKLTQHQRETCERLNDHPMHFNPDNRQYE